MFGGGPGGPMGDCGPASWCAIITGSLLSILGLVSLGVGIALATYYTGFSGYGYAYAPLWAGLLCALAGLIGLSTCCCCGNYDLARWLIVGFAGFCLLVVITGLIQVVLEGMRSSELSLIDDYEITNANPVTYNSLKAMHTTASIFGGIAALTAFIASIMLCCCVCCDDVQGPVTPVVMQNTPNVIRVPQQQSIINVPAQQRLPGIISVPAQQQSIINVPAQQQGIILNQGLPTYNQGAIIVNDGPMLSDIII
ncbi:uncharacterized protein [Amphiura filiformis]|uniref:uncharacterized protein n=1 Tax=Amphiura filiformis TaxID=82378 RepID=UPI003B20DB32